jgi:DNA-binding transcriptional MocR family regulator
MTYDLRRLRRLRRKGLIDRVPRPAFPALLADRPRPPDRRLLTKTYTRIVNPALAELDPKLPPETAARSTLARAWRAFETALDDRIG